MAVHTPDRGERRPPFDAQAAKRMREALGMTPAHVAYGINAAYGKPIQPRMIAAWERGEGSPTESELNALAGALWCAPGDLLGTPDTLREYRIARGIAADDLALRIGMEIPAYERMEATGQWQGNDRQAAALRTELDLPLPALVRLTGRDRQLAEMLRSAATTRWQAYTRPVCKLLGLPKPAVQKALEFLFEEYHRRMAGTLGWGGGVESAAESSDAGRDFLADVLAHFWEQVGEA
ncbi:helix-turn-helix transcriptional regulator [Streptomyces sp. NPDC047117]|uniref:helix-turn-helix domain-containing protein n=1 Tax=unclassified Streptomyces TaxID=2593676 RepID=UPI0033D0669C